MVEHSLDELFWGLLKGLEGPRTEKAGVIGRGCEIVFEDVKEWVPEGVSASFPSLFQIQTLSSRPPVSSVIMVDDTAGGSPL